MDVRFSGVGIPITALATAVGVSCIVTAAVASHRRATGLVERDKILSGSIQTCSNMCLPLLILSTIPARDTECVAVVFPLMWIAGMTLLDNALTFCGTPMDGRSSIAALRFEPGSVTGITFALCAYMGVRGDHAYGHIFLLAIMGCLTVVTPSQNLKPGCLADRIISGIQKSVLMGCISLIIAGSGLVMKA